MKANEPRKHHYVPQFFLRNFAVDKEKRKIPTVAKHGNRAVWSERSIESVGYEEDFYVHMQNGIPVSVESEINRHVENPISKSETWKKIVSGCSDTLDRSDRGILYALIRHLEARTPHYRWTMEELARQASDEKSEIPFSVEERKSFSFFNRDQEFSKSQTNRMALTSAMWPPENFNSCLLMVLRSPIPLRSSTTPVFALPALPHPAIWLPLPGLSPFQLVLTVNPTTLVSLIQGDFDGTFINQVIDEKTALGFNRHFVGQFSKFEHVRHLITNRNDLITDMKWAHYEVVKESEQSIAFQRRD